MIGGFVAVAFAIWYVGFMVFWGSMGIADALNNIAKAIRDAGR